MQSQCHAEVNFLCDILQSYMNIDVLLERQQRRQQDIVLYKNVSSGKIKFS